MAGRFTFAMIKPDAVGAGNTGPILADVEQAGYSIRAMRQLRMSRIEAEAFYAIHSERPFYGELVEFMSSGPIVALALEADDAVTAWRNTIGATNPADAAEGTIRKRYAESMGRNAVHGSDSDENAVREIGFFFPEGELAILGVSLAG